MQINSDKSISKFLCFILRHKPETIGLGLDEGGWADIDDLIRMANHSSEIKALDRKRIFAVVNSNDKNRFSISEDGLRIRANQGHSKHVDLQLQQVIPPDRLFHGTATRYLERIFLEGLKPKNRQHVHLSTDINTAETIGKRHGKPVILSINSREMHKQGFAFYLSVNSIFLVEFVPVNMLHIDNSPSI